MSPTGVLARAVKEWVQSKTTYASGDILLLQTSSFRLSFPDKNTESIYMCIRVISEKLLLLVPFRNQHFDVFRTFCRFSDRSRNGFEKREKRRRIRRLQDAITENDITKVKEYLQEHFDVDFQYRGQTALQLAVKEGKYDICKLLIEKGADVNAADAEKNSLLNMACWRGHQEIAQLLINNQADVNSQNDNSMTPLNACAYKGEIKTACLLIAANCDTNIADRNSNTPLHTAVRQEQGAMVELLAKINTLLDCYNEDHKTPLILAAELGYSRIVDALLLKGADTNKQNRLGRTAIYEASVNGHEEVIKSLLCYDIDVNLPSTKGCTPLLEAINNNHLSSAQLLVNYSKCDPNKTDKLQHQAPIHAAIRQVSNMFGNDSGLAMDIIKKLIEKGCDVNIQDNQGWSPLYQSAFAGNEELTKTLLENKADLQQKTNGGDTPLHGGVYGNNDNVVEMLMTAGCKINEVNKKGQHPLYAAVMSRVHEQIVKMLIDAGSDLNVQESNHKLTSLHEAIVQYFTPAAMLLIQAGCDINIQNIKKQTPLYTACEKGNDVLVEHMLTLPHCKVAGASPTAIPLNIATVNNFSHIVQKLISGGADINALNFDGMTPIMVASQENSVRVAKVLLKNGCDLQAHAKVKKLLKCCLFHEDAHPHFDLEPMFLAFTHKNFELLELYVRCYKHPPYRLIKDLSDILRTARELQTHMSKQERQKLLQFYKETLDNPRSLQETCRAHIRDFLGSGIYQKVEKLPLASRTKEYLLMAEVFPEVDAEEDEEDRNAGKFTFVGRRLPYEL